MEPKIVKASAIKEYLTPEHCYIFENWSSPKVSIARARIEPSVTTVPHHLIEVDEYYLIAQGEGVVKIGSLKPQKVGVGDVVFVPAFTSQSVTNTGKTDLIFHCICTPKFTESCYVDEEAAKVKKP
jgi:mannose-6-phosphate isomerase-like protein (cupin superfamily)